MIFTRVTGPPCSGKTTYVQKMRGELDIVLDLDAIMQALGSPVTHGHDKSYVYVANAARTACLRHILQKGVNANVWFITCWPSPEEQALIPRMTSRFQTTATAEECKRWAVNSGRPEIYAGLIDNWFAAHTK